MSDSNKKRIIVCSPRNETLEGLFKDCVIKGNEEACRWFNYYFYEDPCDVKCIYTNCWNIAHQKHK